VKKHIGDRRGRARFEIVGTLTGTLETWRRLEIRNLAEGGALLDTPIPFAPGSRISGRLSFRGRVREVRGEVRHITTLVARDDARYLVGVQWDPSARIADLLTTETMKPMQTAVGQGTERRDATRFIAGPDAELGQPHWSTVELIDISQIGVLFSTPTRLDVGERGELRVRLEHGSFTAQIETKRSELRKTPHTTYRVGAAFVSLDEGSRLHLEEFIGDARR
jgi:hypothetical protein